MGASNQRCRKSVAGCVQDSWALHEVFLKCASREFATKTMGTNCLGDVSFVERLHSDPV